MRGWRLSAGLLLALGGCGDAHESSEAGVGGDRTGCGLPGTHSVAIADHSCVCEDGYAWCSDALDEFECCPTEVDPDPEPPDAPTEACDADRLEALTCVSGPEVGDPTGSEIWACNGERWVLAPSYATFACVAEGFAFAYGCAPGQPEPSFVCGHGPGTTCEVDSFGGVCVDEDIVDTCVWGRRTTDRCSRLCAELGAFGEGFTTGACEQPTREPTATCACE